MLKSEISTLQHHLQAISDNRTHIRNQVEILAAEVENLNDTNNSMNAHIMELNSWQSFKHKECEELLEDKSELTEENAKLKNKLETLQTEIENSRKGATEPEHSQHININDMEQELIELHSENESLVDEINELQDKLNEKEEVIKALNETVDENEAIRSENEDLQQQNNELQSHFQSLREKLTQLDELIEKNKAAEVDNDALGERLDVLQKRIVEIQKEKQALQTMTDDLTNMLHDMQTKYEEVKSEMESTKKKCDKEINHLQNQLHEMNEDVSELRKMLDYMENEMYSHAEEKTILKENLEQQQSQFVEVCEQKQKLEEILSEKQQKDLKNMQMASQRQKNNSLNTSRSETDIPCSVNMTMDDNQSQCEQDLPCNDQNDNESQTEIREMNTQPMEEVLRDSTDSDFSDIIPSFESAFHLFGLASSDESASLSRMVQTNITIRSFDDVGFLLDDNEEKTKNDQVLVKIDIETQTDIVKTFNEFSLEVFPNIDIPGNDSVMVSQDLRNETVNMEVCDSEHVIESDIFFQTKDFASSETGEESDTTGKGHAFSQISDTTVNKCDTASQVDFEVESISCQTVTRHVQNSENQRLLSLDIDNEDMSETISANFSILSADSGIQSACPGADGSNIPFQYPDRNNMKTIEDSNTEFKNDDKVDGIEVNNSVAKLECVEESSQTDRGFESELESAIAEVKEQLEIEFNEKSVELEAEIESRVLTNLDSREQKVHSLEESYDRKIKQMEYEIEEKYEQKFRMREVEIAFEAERDIKAQATKAKNAAEIEIEKIKREKDQQFVETLQKVKADLNKKQRKESGDMRRSVSYDSSSERRDQEIGPEGDATQMLDGTFQKFAEDQEVRKLYVYHI
jgi:DNA repair exonuclease SbcCD ATPase subunit